MISLKAAYIVAATLTLPLLGASQPTIQNKASQITFDADSGLIASLSPAASPQKSCDISQPSSFLASEALLRLHDALQTIRAYLEERDLRDPHLVEQYLGEDTSLDIQEFNVADLYTDGFAFDDVYTGGVDGLTWLATSPQNLIGVSYAYYNQVVALEAVLSDEALIDLQETLTPHLKTVSTIADGQKYELMLKEEDVCSILLPPHSAAADSPKPVNV